MMMVIRTATRTMTTTITTIDNLLGAGESLKRVLPKGARVGTVDKFQGQESAVVVVAMTTSSGEYLPRGIQSGLNFYVMNVTHRINKHLD